MNFIKTAGLTGSAIIAIIAGLGISAPAQAQDAAATNENEGEIVVNARRRDERLQDVPLSITAVTDTKLKALDIRDTVALANYTPGLQLSDASFGRNDRGGGRSMIFRGLNLASGSGVTAGALVFLDGAPLLGGEVPVGDDIARVEVLRGPQNVYFGRSTLSGAVSYTTKDIGDEWHAFGQVKVATYNTRDIEGSVSGPLSPGFGVRLSGRTASNDGYYDNAGNPGEKLGARKTNSISGTIEGKPSDTLSVKVYTSYFENDDGLSASGMVPRSANTCNLGGARKGYCGALPNADNVNIWYNSVIPQAVQDVIYNGSLLGDVFERKVGAQRHAFLTHGIIKWDFSDFATLQSITAYHRDKNRSTADALAADTSEVVGGSKAFYYTFGYDTQDFSQELRLNSKGDGPLRWTLGGSYVDASSKNQSVTYGINGSGVATPGSLTNVTISAAKAYGAFAGLYYSLAQGLTLSGEGRYQIDKRADTGANGQTLSKSYKSFSPRVTIDYKVDSDVNVFASFASGVRPGGFNRYLIGTEQRVIDELKRQGVDTSIAYDEEKLDMYEAGVKAALLGRSLFVNLTGYYGTLKGQQVSVAAVVSLPASGTSPAIQNTYSTINNIGKTHLYGIEFDGSWRLNSLATIGATAAYNETEIKRYSCVACSAFTGTTDVVGNHLPNAPRYTASATLDLKDAVGSSGWDWFYHADYVYRGKIFFNEINAGWLPDRHLVNMRLGVEKDGLMVEGFVSNLFNNKELTGAYVTLDSRYPGASQTTNSVELVALPEPRIWGGRIRYAF